MKLCMVGCSHHGSAVDIRERLAFTQEQARIALDTFRSEFPGAEAVLLSTCNRVELYAASEDPSAPVGRDALVQFIAGQRHCDPQPLMSHLLARNGEEAVRHLFAVAAGVDSMVVGESQILSQVKQAYEIANDRESTGPLTHAAFQAAVRTAKRVQTETDLHRRRVSIPSVAVVDFGAALFERFDDKRILVLGAGEMADETLAYLRDAGAKDVIVLNRSMDRARDTAARHGGRSAPWHQLPELLSVADIVISATGASEPVVTREMFHRVEAARAQRTLFILDLAMPRDVEPAVGDCLGVYLYCLDDLQAACERNRRERARELPRVERIIDEESLRFMAEWRHRATGPIIKRLRNDWEAVKDEELQRLMQRLPNLDQATQAEIAASFRRLTNKLLHPPLESLREEAAVDVPHALIDALKRLFKIRD